MSTPDVEKAKGKGGKKRRRSARVYINANRPLAVPLDEIAAAFPPDADDDDGQRVMQADVGKRDFSQAERRRLAGQGQALPDGSYPVPDEDALRRAAILARTGHGDHEAAKKLIRRRAKELGVPVPDLGDSAEKSYLGDPYPAQQYAGRRVSEPHTQGRQSPATDDHGVGQGRNPGLAAHHGDLRQSSVNAFDAVSRLMTVLGDNQYGDRSVTMTAGQVGLSMFNAAGRAGTYDGMRPTARTPVRPPDHIAQGSATGPNGGHSLSDPQSHALKNSELRAEFKRMLFPGSRAR